MSSQKKPPQPVKVLCKIIYLKVGEVDSKNENFKANVFIELQWEDDALLKSLVSSGKKIHRDNLEYNKNVHWSPQVYIENALGDPAETVEYKLDIVEKESTYSLDRNVKNKRSNGGNLNNQTVRVTEAKKLKGAFYERLELYDFPLDLQEISVKLSSKKSIDEVVLLENQLEASAVNTDDFQDQQQWDLFENVKATSGSVNDVFRKYERAQFQVSAFVVRKPGYYLYNAFLLIFLITCLGFTPFSFAATSPQFRCQVTGLLLLTEVNFRWIITQRLPAVSYLTLLDKYAIGCIIILVFFCVWHALIGSYVIYTSTSAISTLDFYLLYGFAAYFFVFNIIFLVLYFRIYLSVKRFKEEHMRETTKQDSPPPNMLVQKS